MTPSAAHARYFACYHERVSDVYALVRSIREKRWARNRNFDEHATPTGAQARRVHRFLAGIERDVLEAEDVEVERAHGADGSGVWRVTMRFPSVRLHRVVSLTDGEHAILVEDARLAERLKPRA